MGGGLKRKIPLELIENKGSRQVAFSKRTKGLYSKASELCLLSGGAQIAILTTPCSSNSNASFYSFGHSSVDAVVAAFLSDQRPVREENLGLGGFWWEEKRLAKSENVEELRDAIDSMSKMLRTLKDSRLDSVTNYQRDRQDDVMKNNDIKKKDPVAQETQKVDQTLDLQSTSAIFDGLPENSNKISEEQDQILASSETLCITTGNLEGYTNEAPLDDLDQLIDFGTNFESSFDETLLMDDYSMDLWSDDLQSTSAIFDDLPANSNTIAEDQDQILASSETLCITDIPTGNLEGYTNEAPLDDLDQLIDFGTNFESSFDETLLMDDYSMDLWSDDLQSTSAIFDDLPANSNTIAEDQDQILASSETLCITDIPTGNLEGYTNEAPLDDLDQLIDFGTNFESSFDETLLMDDYSMDLWSDDLLQ